MTHPETIQIMRLEKQLAEARGALYTRTKEFETMCAGYKRDQAEIKALRTAAERVVSKLESMKEFGDEPDEDDLQEWHEALVAAREEAERKAERLEDTNRDIVCDTLLEKEIRVDEAVDAAAHRKAERDELQQRLDAVREAIMRPRNWECEKGESNREAIMSATIKEASAILAGTEGGQEMTGDCIPVRVKT